MGWIRPQEERRSGDAETLAASRRSRARQAMRWSGRARSRSGLAMAAEPADVGAQPVVLRPAPWRTDAQDEHRHPGAQTPHRPVAVHHRRRRDRGGRDEGSTGDDLTPPAERGMLVQPQQAATVCKLVDASGGKFLATGAGYGPTAGHLIQLNRCRSKRSYQSRWTLMLERDPRVSRIALAGGIFAIAVLAACSARRPAARRLAAGDRRSQRCPGAERVASQACRKPRR
jgi:hypothetical protein